MESPPYHARLTLVETTAQNVLMGARIQEPPVPVKNLLEQYADVHLFDDAFERGFCFEKNSICHVYINRSIGMEYDSYIRAHELGHLLLNHLQIDQTHLTETQLQQLKREADYFADCLLMPAEWVRSACRNHWIDFFLVHKLKRVFSVSYVTMNRRLHDLGMYARENAQHKFTVISRRSMHCSKKIFPLKFIPRLISQDDYYRH